jgi:serine/threonine protein kinase
MQISTPRSMMPAPRMLSTCPPQMNGRMLSTCSPQSNGISSLASSELAQRYDITGVTLGAGKHSDVVQARSKADGQNYACKMIPIGESDDYKIQREIRAMASFKHQLSSNMVENMRCSTNLPNVRGAPPYCCIVMNQIDGEPLTAHLLRSGSSPSLAWKLSRQMASVLKDMHSQGLVHRDIWSENIMMGRDGNFYLIDYGCAEFCASPSAKAMSDSLNIPYLSPEICKKQPPSPGDDMWALGLVLVELVTGKHIIHRMGSNADPFFTKEHLFQAALNEVEAMGGPQMGMIVKKLLAKSASERATASDVLAMSMGQQQNMGLPASFSGGAPVGFSPSYNGSYAASFPAPVSLAASSNGSYPPFKPQGVAMKPMPGSISAPPGMMASPRPVLRADAGRIGNTSWLNGTSAMKPNLGSFSAPPTMLASHVPPTMLASHVPERQASPVPAMRAEARRTGDAGWLNGTIAMGSFSAPPMLASHVPARQATYMPALPGGRRVPGGYAR